MLFVCAFGGGIIRTIDLHEIQSFEFLERNQTIMGTTARLVLPSQFAALHNTGFSLLQQIDSELSTYQSDSPVSMLNRTGAVENPPSSLLEILKLSREANQETQGYFDAMIGSATLDVYHFDQLNTKSPEHASPPKGSIKSWFSEGLSLGSFDNVEISEKRVRFLRQGLKVDFGGIGKGYAIDRVAELMKARGVRVGRFGLSGDIRCFGSCAVMIEDPRTLNLPAEGRALAVLYSKGDEMAFSTSGVSYRYLQNKNVNHLLDPHTLKPQQNILSVTLFGRVSNSKLDAYTTAVAVMPNDQALSWLARHGELGYVIVLADSTIRVSRNLEELLKFFVINSQI